MANLNTRIDDTLKQQAEKVFEELGMNMTTAATAFLKQCIRCNGIPFELRLDPFYSAVNQSHLMDAKARMEASSGAEHDLLEVCGG